MTVPSVPDVDLRACPDFLAGLITWNDEGVVGWRALTERTTGEPCQLGCLAVGSSPHFHTKIVGYQLVTTHGIYEFHVDGVCYRCSTLHPIPRKQYT